MNKIKLILLSVLVAMGSSAYANNESDFFDYEVFKTVSLPSFPGMQIPIYKSSGTQGPPILLVHGNSSSSRSYVFQMFSLLGQRRQVFLMDLPGHGNASKVDPSLPLPMQPNGLPLGFAEYQTGLIESVAVVANDIDVQAEVFVGWSLGGDVILLAQGLGLLPANKGIFIFGTSPAGANPPTAESPFKGPDVPGLPGLSILASFGFSFQLDAASPIGFNLFGEFTDSVPSYAPAPISDAPTIGDAYVRGFFKASRRLSGNVPQFFLEDAFGRSDDRFRASLGVVGLGLLPPGPVTLPDELQVLQSLQGDPADPSDDIPIAVVVGQQDAFVNTQYLIDLKNAGIIPTLWNGEILQVRRAGHAIHFERPFLFNRLLRRFVNSID